MNSRPIRFAHNGRNLEIRTNTVADTIEVWIFEDGRALQFVTAIPAKDVATVKASDGHDLVNEAMIAAESEIESGKLELRAPAIS
jgi:hypothetical protein